MYGKLYGQYKYVEIPDACEGAISNFRSALLRRNKLVSGIMVDAFTKDRMSCLSRWGMTLANKCTSSGTTGIS